jgi:hypothetical protein
MALIAHLKVNVSVTNKFRGQAHGEQIVEFINKAHEEVTLKLFTYRVYSCFQVAESGADISTLFAICLRCRELKDDVSVNVSMCECGPVRYRASGSPGL